MSSLLPLACFGAAIIVIAGAGAAGVWLTLRLSRSERFRRLAGGSERMRETRDRDFFWTGEAAVARANAAREFAAKRGHRYRDDAMEWSDGDCTCTLYTEKIEDSESTTTYMKLRVATPELQLPAFSITTRTFFSGQGITFADDPEFSERYVVESSDEARARRVLTRNVRQTIVSSKTWRVDSDAKTLVFTDLEHTTTVGFERFVDDSMTVVRALRQAT